MKIRIRNHFTIIPYIVAPKDVFNMPLSIRTKVFLFAILLGTYMVSSSLLIDKFHVSRFIYVSAINIFSIIWILPKLKNIRLQLFDGVLFAFYGLHVLSLSWSLNFAEAIFTAQKTLLLLLSYLLIRLILEKVKDSDKWVALAVLATSIFTLVVTSVQVLQVGTEKGLGGKTIYELTAFSGHKNLVASFIFFLFCYLVSKASFIKYKKLLIVTLIWQLLLILVFRSRAVYLGLFSFGLVGGVYYLWRNSNYKNLLFYKVLPSLLVVGFLTVIVANKTPIGQTYLKYLNPTTYQQSASALERQFVWHKTWQLIEDRPLVGYGSGNWKIFFPSKSIQGGFRLQEKGLVFTRAHNDFLEVWTEVGTIGILLYLSLFGIAFTAIFFSIRQASDQQKKTRLVWLGAALLGYILIAFFDFPKERIEHQVFLELLFATIMAECKDVLQTAWPSIKLNKRQKFLLIGVLFLCWLPNIPVSWGRALGDHNSSGLIAAKNQKNAKRIKTLSSKIPTFWYSVDPITIPIKWYEGLGDYFENNYTAALSKFEESYEINPYNFHVLNNYASTLAQLERYEEAIPIFEKALVINPTFESAIFNLSFSYFNLGQHQEALKWANKIEKDVDKKAMFIQQIKNEIDNGN